MRATVICSLLTLGCTIVLAIVATNIHEHEGVYWALAATCFIVAAIIWAWPVRDRSKPNLPNTKVSDAVDYIVNDSIAILRKASSSEPCLGVEHEDARAQLNAKLNTGEIKSWGLRQINTHVPNQFESSLREIPKEYWNEMRLCFRRSPFTN
jgi:hypothetical protein